MRVQQGYKLHQKGKKEISNIELQRMIRKCEWIAKRTHTITAFRTRLSNITMEYRDDKFNIVLIDNDGYKYLERIIREG